jgi:hypothetical protein
MRGAFSMHGIMKAYNQNKRSLGITRHKLEVTHKMGVCVCVCVCVCICLWSGTNGRLL